MKFWSSSAAASASRVITPRRTRISPSCGAGDSPAGTTDANGDVHATFAPEHAASLWLQTESSDGYYAAAGDQRRMLSEAELAQLFRTGVLTVKWRPPK